MMKLLRAAFVAAFFACAALQPSGAMAQQVAAFAPSGQAALAASTSSARIALPTGDPTALVQNLGSVTVYLAFGRGTINATTGGYPIQAGQSIAFAPGIYTHLAAITAGGSATLSVTTGTGIPALANAGGGGGAVGGGAVSVADGADITQGAQADAACATDNGACSIAALLKRANQRSTSLIAALGTPATAALQTTLNGYVDGIETQLTTIDGRVDGLEGQMTSALAKLDTVITNTDRTADVAESTAPTSVKFDQTTPGTTDSVTVKGMGVQGTGSTFDPPTGGSGLFGWLSGIYKAVTGTLTVQGGVAQGATATGNGFRMMGRYNATGLSSVSTGQMQDWSMSAFGGGRVHIGGVDSATNFVAVTSATPALANPGMSTLATSAFCMVRPTTSTWEPCNGDAQGAVVQPFAKRSERWNYAAPGGGLSNTTTFVTIKAAAGAATKNCFYGVQISSDALGAAGEYAVRDGAGGAVLWRIKLQTSGVPVPVDVSPPAPICGSDNTLLEFGALTASVTGAVYANFQGHAQVP